MHPTVSEGVVKQTKSTRMKLSLSLSSQALILAQIGVESLYNNICVCVSFVPIINPSFHRWLGHNFTLKLFRELFQIYFVAQAERKTFFVLSTKSKKKKFINGRRGETYPHFILEEIEIIDDYATDIIPHAAPPRLRTQWYIKRCNYCKGDFHLTTISFLLSTPLFFYILFPTVMIPHDEYLRQIRLTGRVPRVRPQAQTPPGPSSLRLPISICATYWLQCVGERLTGQTGRQTDGNPWKQTTCSLNGAVLFLFDWRTFCLRENIQVTRLYNGWERVLIITQGLTSGKQRYTQHVNSFSRSARQGGRVHIYATGQSVCLFPCLASASNIFL
jgi:hypothetical protein